MIHETCTVNTMYTRKCGTRNKRNENCVTFCSKSATDRPDFCCYAFSIRHSVYTFIIYKNYLKYWEKAQGFFWCLGLSTKMAHYHQHQHCVSQRFWCSSHDDGLFLFTSQIQIKFSSRYWIKWILFPFFFYVCDFIFVVYIFSLIDIGKSHCFLFHRCKHTKFDIHLYSYTADTLNRYNQ